jgi:hypothetical protein
MPTPYYSRLKCLACCEKNYIAFSAESVLPLEYCKIPAFGLFPPSHVNEGASVYNGRPTVGGKVISAHCVAT